MKDRAIVSVPPRPVSAVPKLRSWHALVTRVVVAGICGQWLAACSLSVPMGKGTEDIPTGTIKRAALSPFSAEMDAEDWRRAKSALDTALDPQGNGASVAWENPTSGAKGSFVPMAQPYPKDDGICRPFTAHLNLKGEPERVIASSACRVNSGDWIVGRVLPLSAKTPTRTSNNLADRGKSSHVE
jgi:surface antigen